MNGILCFLLSKRNVSRTLTTPLPPITQNLLPFARKKVKNAFDLFDREAKSVVVKEEIGTIMRYLGAYPSEEELVHHQCVTLLQFSRVYTNGQNSA